MRTEREIWLLIRRDKPNTITYLDAVEEAICFGWIDGIAKKHRDAMAQRFTPRRPRSNWTELNKERARRLIAASKMAEAGRKALPDLSDVEVRVPDDIRARLQAARGAWEFFQRFPALYQRVRLGYIEEMRKRDPDEWEKRLPTSSPRRRRTRGSATGTTRGYLVPTIEWCACSVHRVRRTEARCFRALARADRSGIAKRRRDPPR